MKWLNDSLRKKEKELGIFPNTELFKQRLGIRNRAKTHSLELLDLFRKELRSDLLGVGKNYIIENNRFPERGFMKATFNLLLADVLQKNPAPGKTESAHGLLNGFDIIWGTLESQGEDFRDFKELLKTLMVTLGKRSNHVAGVVSDTITQSKCPFTQKDLSLETRENVEAALESLDAPKEYSVPLDSGKVVETAPILLKCVVLQEIPQFSEDVFDLYKELYNFYLSQT